MIDEYQLGGYAPRTLLCKHSSISYGCQQAFRTAILHFMGLEDSKIQSG